MPVYKVVEHKQTKFLGGRIKPKDLEKLINKGAEGGWSLDRILVGPDHEFLTGGRDVFLLVFRKDEENDDDEEE